MVQRACALESCLWKGVYLCVAVSKGMCYRVLERCASLCGCVQGPVEGWKGVYLCGCVQGPVLWWAGKVCISVWLCPRACTMEGWKGVYLFVAMSKGLYYGGLERCESWCGCVQGPVL